jgi:hypothetical protein
MANILQQTYISKVIIGQNTNNDDVIQISTDFLSANGDVFTLDTRAISPSVIQTTSSISELKPEVSAVYPFKIVTPVDVDGSTILQSPSSQTQVTASQNYYTPIYFERYRLEILQLIDKQFNELTVFEQVDAPNDVGGVGDEFGLDE